MYQYIVQLVYIGVIILIKTKKDYLNFLELDRKSRKENTLKPRLFGDEIWKFQRLLRKIEYFTNVKKSKFAKLYLLFLRFRYHKLQIKYDITIPPNVFDTGLVIMHTGSIIVNSDVRVGKNCLLFQGVTIGQTRFQGKLPVLGDNICIAAGAKIFGEITLVNNIAIGANAVVTKSFDEYGITIAGIPARKINNKGIEGLIDVI